MTSLVANDRAQAIGIARFFLSLGVGAIVVYIVSRVTAPIFARAETQSAGTSAAKGTTWLRDGATYLPVMFVLIAGFGLVAYSVYSREVL